MSRDDQPIVLNWDHDALKHLEPERILQRIVKVVANEFSVKIFLENGCVLEIVGHNYDGCAIGVEFEFDEDVATPYVFPDRPAAKSSTSVAAAATTCRVCGCSKGPGTRPRANCPCGCH